MRQPVVLAAVIAATVACSGGKSEQPPPPTGKLVFKDDFERSEPGDDWHDTGGGYTIVRGELRAKGAYNKPLWLKRKLPNDVRVDLTARSISQAVDIKVELFGDGVSRAEQASYTATSYVFILGGWNNKLSIIARLDEHGDDRAKRGEPRGVPGKLYRFSIVRQGGAITWWLDGERFLEMQDDKPLAGPGHEHLAINNWESEVYFDDLAIYAL